MMEEIKMEEKIKLSDSRCNKRYMKEKIVEPRPFGEVVQYNMIIYHSTTKVNVPYYTTIIIFLHMEDKMEEINDGSKKKLYYQARNFRVVKPGVFSESDSGLGLGVGGLSHPYFPN